MFWDLGFWSSASVAAVLSPGVLETGAGWLISSRSGNRVFCSKIF